MLSSPRLFFVTWIWFLFLWQSLQFHYSSKSFRVAVYVIIFKYFSLSIFFFIFLCYLHIDITNNCSLVVLQRIFWYIFLLSVVSSIEEHYWGWGGVKQTMATLHQKACTGTTQMVPCWTLWRKIWMNYPISSFVEICNSLGPQLFVN